MFPQCKLIQYLHRLLPHSMYIYYIYLGKGDTDSVHQRPCAGTGALNEASMPFADSLLASLGRGAQSCTQLQESAMAMVLESEGHCSSVTKAISKIGCSGKYPGNCERDLFNILSLPVDPWES